MTLKEELEILRGEPIEVFTGDPMDIPCIETSDPDKLCKHPVVSVVTCTYNHEPYIRQAIESVMMQKTDFEFELIIGEDCSQDKTREICFEYQKKYPSKIRVLWWHENVSKLGGNGRRCRAHSRGEFIALCEGDDYWIDPLKLQKQVDVMRKHPNVGFCFARGRIDIQGQSESIPWNEKGTYSAGVVKGREFMLKHLFGVRFDEGAWETATFLLTASVLVRKCVVQEAYKRFEVFKWKLRLGDTTLWLGLAALSDAYYLPDVVSVYRQVSTGFCQRIGGQVCRDATIVRLFYYAEYFRREFSELPIRMQNWIYLAILSGRAKECKDFRSEMRYAETFPHLGNVVRNSMYFPINLIQFIRGRYLRLLTGRYCLYVLNPEIDPKWILEEYKMIGVSYRNDLSKSFCRRIANALRMLHHEKK